MYQRPRTTHDILSTAEIYAPPYAVPTSKRQMGLSSRSLRFLEQETRNVANGDRPDQWHTCMPSAVGSSRPKRTPCTVGSWRSYDRTNNENGRTPCAELISRTPMGRFFAFLAIADRHRTQSQTRRNTHSYLHVREDSIPI